MLSKTESFEVTKILPTSSISRLLYKIEHMPSMPVRSPKKDDLRTVCYTGQNGPFTYGATKFMSVSNHDCMLDPLGSLAKLTVELVFFL